jgi:subtilisin family serine protease
MFVSLVRALAATAVLGIASASAQTATAPVSSSPSLLALQSKAAAGGGSIRVIVELRDSVGIAVPDSPAGDAALAAVFHDAQTAVAARTLGTAGRIETRMDAVPMFVTRATPAELARLAADPMVLRIHEDRIERPLLQDSLPIIKMTGASGAYALKATGAGRAVAILDTGVNAKHEFLKGKVIAEACFSSTVKADGSTSLCPGGAKSSTKAGSGADCSASIDGCGHGTHVAGIAAGKNPSPTSNEPANGVALEAGIVAIKVFSRFSGSNCFNSPCALTYTSDQIKALEHVFSLRGGVKNRKIDAVNMSLGGSGTTGFCNTDPRKKVIDKLRGAGIATVIASGNSGFINGVGFPACIQTAITVGSSTKRASGSPERMSSFTNQGPQVDLLAPGGDGASSLYPFFTSRAFILSSRLNDYEGLAGTSMAAPHVAGAIAAIRSRPACRSKTVTQIENALRSSGPTITDHRKATGFEQLKERRLDVPAAMKKMGCA